jgi:hypothetical protein
MLAPRIAHGFTVLARNHEGCQLDNARRFEPVGPQQGDDVRESLIGLFGDGPANRAIRPHPDLA